MNEDWQDMESAPRDGTRILFYHGKDVAICWWGSEWDMVKGEKIWGWRSDLCEDFGGFEEPEGWMHLPRPGPKVG
jgi:hypothetical protein